ADPDAEDTFYHQTALGWSAYKGNAEVVSLLLAHNAKGVGDALLSGIYAKKPAVIDVVLATGRISAGDLPYALQAAERNEAPEIVERLRKAGAVPPPKADAKVDAAVLARYVGKYRQESGTEEFELSLADGGLQATFGGRTFKMGAIDDRHFQHMEA